MVANNTKLLEESELLIFGSEDVVPIGQQPAYTIGALDRIEEWSRRNDVDSPNVLEFLVEPNAYDGFRRFAATWPNPNKQDSMNERVLASFLNLKGWLQVTGGFMFEEEFLGATGQIGLNSRDHSPFQNIFYTTDQQRRAQWLDPFLNMVPSSACAAAASAEGGRQADWRAHCAMAGLTWAGSAPDEDWDGGALPLFATGATTGGGEPPPPLPPGVQELVRQNMR